VYVRPNIELGVLVETMAGGAGAGPSWHGRSGVHTHMTNTRITVQPILFCSREAFPSRVQAKKNGIDWKLYMYYYSTIILFSLLF
jgi:hypothetical protein